MQSQVEEIRAALMRGESITPLDALNRWGCMRLGGRILELRKTGLPIVTRIVRAGKKRYAEYSLQASGQLKMF